MNLFVRVKEKRESCRPSQVPIFLLLSFTFVLDHACHCLYQILYTRDYLILLLVLYLDRQWNPLFGAKGRQVAGGSIQIES